MSRIIATQYVSLDGVIEDPVGMENSGLGNWIGPFSRGPDGDKFKDDELRDAAAVMLGRRTYDGFAAVWPTVKIGHGGSHECHAEIPGLAHDRQAGVEQHRAARRRSGRIGEGSEGVR